VRISVVVPAYNEARLIARTLASIPPFVERVVVVDDASHDDTARRALAVGDARVQVIRHGENRGVGAAIVTGYDAAFAAGAEICVVMAGDGQMDPDDLLRLVAPVQRGEAVYAKGDRLSFPGARRRMPLTRWLGNLVLAQLTGWAVGCSVRDSQCGYTALSREGAKKLPLEKLWQRYGYPNDLLGMLSERDLPVSEVVVRPVYADEESGIRLWHALFVVPFVLVRALMRRVHYAVSCSRAEARASTAGSHADLHSSLIDVAQVTAELP
jgi:glycosyltransferase involved in cell wall biosynthesis